MRVAPVGLLPGLGLSAVAGRARLTASVTHAHPLAQDGAVAQAVAVALAARSTPGVALDADGVAAMVASHMSTAQFSLAVRRVPPLVHERATPTDVAAVMGRDASALVGARRGERAVPVAWLRRLEEATRLHAAADTLARLDTSGR
jgi:poly(ADP-ribose) glycohydrolase ARH3